MNTFLAATAIVASLGAALPAAAQTFDRGDRGFERGYDGGGLRGPSDDRGVALRIDRGVRNGSLTPSEARSLSRQLDDLRRIEWQYSRNGLDRREARDLDRRYADLEFKVRAESRDQDNRWNGRGYGQGYGDRSFNGFR